MHLEKAPKIIPILKHKYRNMQSVKSKTNIIYSDPKNIQKLKFNSLFTIFSSTEFKPHEILTPENYYPYLYKSIFFRQVYLGSKEKCDYSS